MNVFSVVLISIVVCLAAFLHPVLVFALAAAAFFVFLMLRESTWGLWLLILTIPAGQLARIPVFHNGAQEVALMLNDILIPLIVGLWLAKKFLRREVISLPRNTVLLVLFAFLAGFSLVASLLHFDWGSVMAGGLYLARWLEYAALFFVAYDVLTTERRVQFVLWAFVFSGIALSFLGFVQYVLFFDFSFMVQYGWDPHLGRLVSTFFDPNFTAMFLVIVLTIILAFWYRKMPKDWIAVGDKSPSTWTRDERLLAVRALLLKVALILVALVTGFALVLTYSRSGILALVLILLFFGVVRDRRLIFVTVLCGLLVFALFPRYEERLTESFDPSTSAYKRLESWGIAFHILDNTNPLIGIGYNNYRAAQIAFDYISYYNPLERSGAGTDSSLLLILVTTGIGGVFIYLLLLSRIILMGFETYAQHLFSIAAFGVSFAAIIIGMLVQSQFVNSLLYPFFLIYFWIGVAVVTRFSQK